MDVLPRRIDRKNVYSDEILTLNKDKVLLPSGRIIDNYHVLSLKSESVVILLLNSANEICFIKSPRYITQNIEWELPSGFMNPEESAIQAGIREVLEETGYHIKTVEHVYSFYPANAISNQKAHILLARLDASMPQSEYDHDEVSEIIWLDRNKIEELIADKKIMDGYALTSILYYFNFIEK